VLLDLAVWLKCAESAYVDFFGVQQDWIAVLHEEFFPSDGCLEQSSVSEVHHYEVQAIMRIVEQK
jgi:hypothetical protein